jgi:hypothetical protein
MRNGVPIAGRLERHNGDDRHRDIQPSRHRPFAGMNAGDSVREQRFETIALSHLGMFPQIYFHKGTTSTCESNPLRMTPHPRSHDVCASIELIMLKSSALTVSDCVVIDTSFKYRKKKKSQGALRVRCGGWGISSQFF